MTTPIGYGIDVSHFQAPLQVKACAGKVSFVMVRASFGSALKDDRCVDHVQAARSIGAKVGLYHFFRPSQSVKNQFAVLCEMAALAGIHEGDIVPALDIERDPFDETRSDHPNGREVDPSWSEPAMYLTDMIVERFGDCIAYITHREWLAMGSPDWVLDRPLWTAHYTNAAVPSTPGGKQATIWQHRVGLFDPNGPGGYFEHDRPQIDQNRLFLPLPLIARPELSGDDRERAEGLVALTTQQSAEEALHGAEPFPLDSKEPKNV